MKILKIHKINNMLWGELIGYIENNASSNSSVVASVFVAVLMFLPSRCLATIVRIHIHTG
jgi:hypothetical protein